MTAQFDSAEKRDAFAKRLENMARFMFDAMSQGNDNQIHVTPLMAEDIWTAAVIVSSCTVVVPDDTEKP